MQTQGNNIEIHANGITICYDDFGTGDIPIIFIHGFPFDKSSWNSQIDFLKMKHRVIAYDIRGYGKSTSGSEKLSMTLFADDLIKFMDALEIERASVCGLSMGGYILLNALSRYQERFSAVILCDTNCIADTHETKQKRYKTIELIEAEGLDNFADSFEKNIFMRESLETKKEAVEKIKQTILSNSLQTITGTLNALAERWETCTSLSDVQIPTLILCGKEDIVTPPPQSEFLHKNISNSEFEIIEKAGHMSNLEQPEEFNKHITNFISGLMQ